MKEYRRRFVALSLGWIAVVLLAVFLSVGFTMARNSRRDVFDAMRQVLQPFDGRMMFGQGREDAPSGAEKKDNRSITVVFCRRGAGEGEEADFDVLSNLAGFTEEELQSCVSAIAPLRQTEGSLKDPDVLYCREDARDMVKLALLSGSYLRQEVLRYIQLLSLLYVLSLVIFFFISRGIAALAVRPMEQAMEREAQFVTDLSHDLKTPLTVILANSSILREDPHSTVGEKMTWIESTDASARSMLSMVNEMLTISRVQNDSRTLATEKLDLSSLCERACLQMDSVAYERNLTLTEDLEEGVTVKGNGDYVNRIISSLIENALKYEPAGGSVLVTLRREKNQAAFTVTNPGSVIPGEDLPHIFERFYRVDKSRGDHTGFGLGLAIAREMAQSMGGTLSVQSEAQSGTAFTLRLPLEAARP